MTYEEIFSNLKKKIYHPIYFLMGDETYFIDKISDYISDNILTEAEKGFNQTILYGKDTEPRNIIANARRFPMMSNYQVIIIREAQNIKDLISMGDHHRTTGISDVQSAALSEQGHSIIDA